MPSVLLPGGQAVHYELWGGGPVRVLLVPGLAIPCWSVYVRCGGGGGSLGRSDGPAEPRSCAPALVPAAARVAACCPAAAPPSHLAGPRRFRRMLSQHLASLADAGGAPLVSVCSFDLRGLGGSPPPRRLGAYSAEALAGDALGLLDHLGWQVGSLWAALCSGTHRLLLLRSSTAARPSGSAGAVHRWSPPLASTHLPAWSAHRPQDGVHLFGSSLGGQVACKMAAAQPARFASLLLVGAAQGWALAGAALLRRPLVGAAMLAGQLPGLHRLAAWGVLHHLFSDAWLSAPARGAGSSPGDRADGGSGDARGRGGEDRGDHSGDHSGGGGGGTRLAAMLAHSADPARPNLLQDARTGSTARLGQALACARFWRAPGAGMHQHY